MESTSSSCAESVFIGSDCFYGVHKHQKCGLYQDDCREWSRKTRSDKTWSNFKAHFARAFKETQKSSITSKTKGYAAHIHAAQDNAALFADMYQDHTLALANIATDTQANRTLVAMLTKTISDLSRQFTHLTAKVAIAHAKNTRLKNRDILQPRSGTDIGRPAILPRQIQPQAKIEICTPEADINSTLTGTAPPTATRWRRHTSPRRVDFQRMYTTS